jgi:hypothetical protein
MNRVKLAFVLLTAVTVGCSSNRPQPVQGKIVFSDGAAATELAGYLVGMDSGGPEGANGVVQPDGSFRVGTFENDDGAMPGKYKVSLTPPDPPLDQPVPPPIIDPKYSNVETSGLTVEIKPGDNPVTLTVERAKP